MNLRGRYLPPAVVAFVVLQFGGIGYSLAKATNVALAALAIVVIVVWGAVIVVWRQRWAWWLNVIVYVVAAISPAWSKWPAGFTYAFDLLTLALLLSPQMRRYMGVCSKTGATPGASSAKMAP